MFRVGEMEVGEMGVGETGPNLIYYELMNNIEIMRGYGRLNLNITQLQITCTDLLLILAEVDVYKNFFISISFFVVLVL